MFKILSSEDWRRSGFLSRIWGGRWTISLGSTFDHWFLLKGIFKVFVRLTKWRSSWAQKLGRLQSLTFLDTNHKINLNINHETFLDTNHEKSSKIPICHRIKAPFKSVFWCSSLWLWAGVEQSQNRIQAQVLIRQLSCPQKPIFTGKWNTGKFTQQKIRSREQKHKVASSVESKCYNFWFTLKEEIKTKISGGFYPFPYALSVKPSNFRNFEEKFSHILLQI